MECQRCRQNFNSLCHSASPYSEFVSILLTCIIYLATLPGWLFTRKLCHPHIRVLLAPLSSYPLLASWQFLIFHMFLGWLLFSELALTVGALLPRSKWFYPSVRKCSQSSRKTSIDLVMQSVIYWIPGFVPGLRYTREESEINAGKGGRRKGGRKGGVNMEVEPAPGLCLNSTGPAGGRGSLCPASVNVLASPCPIHSVPGNPSPQSTAR